MSTETEFTQTTPADTEFDDSLSQHVSLVVPKALVKTAKNALEVQKRLDKTKKIKLISSESEPFGPLKETGHRIDLGSYLIPTLYSAAESSDSASYREAIFEELDLQPHASDMDLVLVRSPSPPDHLHYPRHTTNPLALTIANWLSTLPSPLLPLPIPQILSASKWAYTLYPTLLLLPPTTLATIPASLHPHLRTLYSLLCSTLHITHIALTAPIPALTPHQSPNIFRAPTSLQPLHGDFGPMLPPMHTPSQRDFDQAFWISARQNGITQTWAPRYTMFSRGNIREKSRLLNLQSLTPEGLETEPAEVTALDFYGGIGYFAFCYARTGVGRVLCWELNPWSVEGLRRGARANGWGVQTIDVSEEDVSVGSERVVLFGESNENAVRRLEKLSGTIGPVRHVNLGLLPSSRGSWEVAVRCLDRGKGGWVHVHENVGVGEIERRTREVVEVFTGLVDEWHGRQPRRRVSCERVERVKDYAPGVVHCVFDIAILPEPVAVADALE